MSGQGIPPHILNEAANWLMRLHGDRVTDAERAACRQWCQRSPDHARAWERAERLLASLDSLPPALAMPTLGRPASAGRRAVLARAAAVLIAAPAGWLVWQSAGWDGWRADYRTATGERRVVILSDGSQVTLNTASAIDAHFDAVQRLIRLRDGEILVATAPDPTAGHRPFRVQTAEGRLEALGTRFSVRQRSGFTSLAVFDGAVRIEPDRAGQGGIRVLKAGERSVLTRHSVEAPQPVDEMVAAWGLGMFMADRTPLGDLVAELARFRRGLLRCDPALAGLRISGAFPLDGSDRALVMLAATYPLRVRSHLNGYWVTLVPR